MATKISRALDASSKKASDYVEQNKRYLSHEYCMSEDQLGKVHDAFVQGFLAGVIFK